MNATTFQHDALLYRGAASLASRLVPWIEEGLRAEEPVHVVTTERNIDELRAGLGPSADDVEFVENTGWYRHPPTTIAAWHDAIREGTSGGARVRAVGEVVFHDEDQHAGWTRYESILNHVFAEDRAWVICPYDVGRLPGPIVDAARRTHPMVWNGARAASDRYTPPAGFLATMPEPLRPMPHGAVPFPKGLPSSQMREEVRVRASAAGWDSARTEDLVLVFTELLTNAERHAGEPGTASLWIDADRAVGEVRDGVGTPIDPLAGFSPPRPSQIGGAGLWIARRLSDWLGIEAVPGEATIVRFGISRPI